MKLDSRRESDDIPNDFLSKPQDLMHWSLSIWSFNLSASISDVLHVYFSSPFLLTCFSRTQRFPADDTANAQVSWFKFSHSMPPAILISPHIKLLEIYMNKTIILEIFYFFYLDIYIYKEFFYLSQTHL